MLTDGGASFTIAVGLEMDTAKFGGIRSKRYAISVVTQLKVEAPKNLPLAAQKPYSQA